MHEATTTENKIKHSWLFQSFKVTDLKKKKNERKILPL